MYLQADEDINVMVFDTEVYSNTGGQASKSTPTGAIAQFAAGGKETKKKDMASIAMSYGYVYVAQISMGADLQPGCQSNRRGRGLSGTIPDHRIRSMYQPWYQEGYEQRLRQRKSWLLSAGYWHQLPLQSGCRRNKFSLDSKAPDMTDYQEFLNGEVRYNSLQRQNPEKAARLFAKNQSEAAARYEYLQKLITLYGTEE